MTITTWSVCWISEEGHRCLLDFEYREDALYMAVKLAESGRRDVTVPVAIETEVDEVRMKALHDRILAKIHGLPVCFQEVA
jgi:hypothetical protein